MKRTALAAPVLGIGCLLGAAPAAAQVIDTYFEPYGADIRGTPTLDNSRGAALSRYEAGGVRAGSFIIRPNLLEGFGYNSNVQGFSGGRGSTFIDSNATVQATSDWNRNALSFGVTAEDRRYLDLPKQNFTTWAANLGGTIQVGLDKIDARYDHQNLIQIPGALDFSNVSLPVAYRVDSAQLSYTARTSGRLTFVPEIDVAHYDFDSYSVGNTRIDQTFRNRTVLQGALTTRYQIGAQQDALVVVRGTNIDYSTAGTTGLPKRNSNGWAVLGGLDYPAPGSNFRFRVLAGVQARYFTSSAYKSLTTPIVEASLIWTPTRLTTVTLLARRDIEDPADDSIAGYTFTAARLSVDHELRRNITLNAFGEILQADFPSASINTGTQTTNEAGTTQTIYNAGVGANWLLNRYLRVGGQFGVGYRSGGGNNYTSTISLLTLGLRL